MNKKEMQDELVNKYGYSQEDVEGKTNAVLEKMLKEAREKAEAEGAETAPEEPKAPESEGTEEDKAGDTAGDETGDTEDEEGTQVLRKRNIILTSVKEHIYVVRHKGSDIVVENKGHGDVYVGGEDDPIIGKLEQLVLRGEKKVLKGVDSVRVISSSSPEVEITEVK